MPQPFDFAKGYVLTDEDVKVLRPLIEKHQRDRGNELLFRYGYEEPYWLDEGPPSQRSGTHIALVPVGGIAALTNPAGTGDDNIAGMAVCSIYQIAIDVTGTIATVVDTGLMERVYNLSLTPITSRYVIVHLDRYGRWVAEASGEDLYWEATMSGSDQAISSTSSASPDVIAFNTVTSDITTGGIWGTLASNALPVNATRVLRFVSTISIYFLDPSVGRSGSTAIWLQKKASGAGSYSDVLRSGFINSQVTQSYGTYFHTYSLNKLVKVTTGDTFRVVAVYANGTAASPYVVSGQGFSSGALADDTMIGACWSISK